MAPGHKQHKHADTSKHDPNATFKPTLPKLAKADDPIPDEHKVGRDPNFTFKPVFTRYQRHDAEGHPVKLEHWNRYEPDGTLKDKIHLFMDLYKEREEPECWDDLSLLQDFLVKAAAENTDILQLVAKINKVAKEALEYHCVAKVPCKGQLREALELVKQARTMGDPEWHERGVTFYTASKICKALYDATEDTSWLEQAADYGEWSTTWLRERENSIPQDMYFRCYIARTEHLAGVYKSFWGCKDTAISREERMDHLQGAVKNQSYCADWTCGVLCAGAEGWFLRDPAELKRWGCTRVIEFNKLVLLLSDFSDLHPDWTKALNVVIDAINERHCVPDGDAEEKLYYRFLVYLCARQWLTTRSEEHYKEFIDHARTLLKYHNSSAGAETSTPLMSSLDNSEDRDVLIYFAGVFHSYADETAADITTRRLCIAYCEHVLSLYSPITSLRHMSRVDFLLSIAQDTCCQIYEFTKKVDDGLQADDWWTKLTLLSSFELAAETIASTRGTPLKLDEDVFANVEVSPRPIIATCPMTSVINDQSYTVVINWPARNLFDQTLKFRRKEEDGENVTACFRMDRWIRGRSEEDGSFLLGGAVFGRDDSVISFLRFPTFDQTNAETMSDARPHPDWDFDG